VLVLSLLIVGALLVVLAVANVPPPFGLYPFIAIIFGVGGAGIFAAVWGCDKCVAKMAGKIDF
jgi:hypothetical protein